LVLLASSDSARAQETCSDADRPTLGVVAGRSSPYFDLDTTAAPPAPSESISVRSGIQVSVRGDLSPAGPLRLRVEGSTARWNVEGRTYSTVNGQITSSRSVGDIAVRQLGAAVGFRAGRAPVCGYVLAGGGLYSLTFRDTTVRHPGFALTAGLEIPTGDRGRVQLEVQLHLIDSDSRYPITSSTAVASALLVGWAYRF
jgi:hypothetical protein